MEVRDGFRVYAIDMAGVYVVEALTAGAIKLSLVGDVNVDSRVDGLDSQLVANGLAGVGGSYDVNGDGVFDSQDLQLLAGNYGFMANLAPVITPVEGLTHVDLTTRIALDGLVKDVEGDLITYGVQAGVNGRAELSADGKYVLFTPVAGYSGTGAFELLASDGLGQSSRQITVKVSDAALVNLDIVNRNPKLDVGDKYQLQVTGDFADQRGVSLPSEYLQYAIVGNPVISIDNRGLITAAIDGAGIAKVSRNGISAYTATRVGYFDPQTDAELNVAFAEEKGLHVYPEAVTLIPGVGRKIQVGIEGRPQAPELLMAGTTGTKYFISNPDILEVSNDGFLIAKSSGVAKVTVINGGAEAIIPVRVEIPQANGALIGKDGGAVLGDDGLMVTVAPGALKKEAAVSIKPLARDQVSSFSEDKFNFVSAFKLDIGEAAADVPLQIALQAPPGINVGQEIFFGRYDVAPDAQGRMVPAWILEESGRVGADGMIRTTSLPWNGARRTGVYTVFVPNVYYQVAIAEINYERERTLSWDIGKSITNIISAIGDRVAEIVTMIDLGKNPYGKLPVFSSIAQTGFEAITVPRIGLPYTNTWGIKINPGQLPSATINIPDEENSEFTKPVVKKIGVEFAEEQFDQFLQVGDPLLYIQADNLGKDIKELRVDFFGAQREVSYSLEIVEYLSNLERGLLVVKPTNQEFLSSNSKVQITRYFPSVLETSNKNSANFKESSKVEVNIEVPLSNLAVIPQSWNNKVAILRTDNFVQTITAGKDNSNLVVAEIPVGDIKPRVSLGDEPRFAAITHDRRRAYVTLEIPGQIAAVDLLTMRQVDTNHTVENDIPGVSGKFTIQLPPTVKPFGIVIDSQDKYAYITERSSVPGNGWIYVLDIDPYSQTFHQVIGELKVDSVGKGLGELVIDPIGKYLYVVNTSSTNNLGKGEILAIEINKNKNGKPKLNVAHRFVVGNQPRGISMAPSVTEGISQIVFTNSGDDVQGVGVITMKEGEPSSGTIRYTTLGLGSPYDYFDVNQGYDITITNNGKYGFVAGRNARFLGQGFASVDGDYRSGTNVGIIKDPLTENAKLIAATRPIYGAYIGGVGLSTDNKVLFATEQLTGSVFGYNVDAIIETIENPSKFYAYKSGSYAAADPKYFKERFDIDLNLLDQPFLELPIDVQEKLEEMGINRYSNVSLRKQYDSIVAAEKPYYDVAATSAAAAYQSYIKTIISNSGGAGNSLVSQEVSSNDFAIYPIDDLNPFIDAVAGDLRHITQNYGLEVPENSATPPLGIGSNPYSVATASKSNDLIGETLYVIDRNINKYNGLEDDKIVIQQQGLSSSSNSVIYAQTVDEKVLATMQPLDAVELGLGLPASVANRNKDLVLVKSIDLRNPFFAPPTEAPPTETPPVETPPETPPIGKPPVEIPPKKPPIETPPPGLDTGIVRRILFGVVGVLLRVAKEVIKATEVNLTISTFPEGEGLDIRDEGFVDRSSRLRDSDLSVNRSGVRDYNPNRVDTLTWKVTDREKNLGQWFLNGTLITPTPLANNQFALDSLNLTAGQKYYWRGEFFNKPTGIRGKIAGGDFTVPQHQPLTPISKTFSSVTVISPDSTSEVADADGYNKALDLAKGIARNFDGKGDNGIILRFDQKTGQWFAPFEEFEPKSNNILAKLGVPLILVDDWSDPSKYESSGFAEESADKLFAALVNFNQAYSGELQNALFNSPFHFIGHGRGAVVNSEVIQRLGTFFPRDKFATMFPDLQMTTIDPTDFEQNGKKYFDPSIQVWQNVTFADNYYQTISQTFNHGRELENTIPPEWSELKGFTTSRADLNVRLNNRVGFAQDSSSAVDNPHNRAFAWYAGTADLSLDGLDSAFGTPIFRRKGDFSQTAFKDGPLTPWYTNDLTPIFPGLPFRSRVELGDADGQWEGVGTGWYYSAIGGGRYRRSQIAPKQNRVQVGFDNTNPSQQPGDFAVPTLFNGNFDVSERSATQPIPGWMFDGLTDVGQNRLKLWSQVLPPASLDLAVHPNNYALELRSGESLVHNPFVLTDWGSLRFNIFAPNLNGGTLNVQLQETGTDNWLPLAATQIQRSEDPLIDDGSGNLIPNPARPNNVGYYDFNNGLYEDPYTHTISYGERGFETFVLDVPDYLRGKSVKLKFTSNANSTIYLDDVFFKSQHLLLGNPTNARTDETNNRNNYLVEKPQYSLSYNDSTKTPNWVSWQLNKSWLGDAKRPGVPVANDVGYPPTSYPPANEYLVTAVDYPWVPDVSNLPSNWIKTIGSDYRSNDRGLEKGHMTAVADRDRSLKDIYATFLTSNMLPQHGSGNNRGAWQNFESDIQDSVESSSIARDYYIIAGGYGYDSNRKIGNRISTRSDGRIIVDSSGTWTLNPKEISIPEFTWKIVVPLEAGQRINDITAATEAIAIMVPNREGLTTPNVNFPLPGEISRTITNWNRWQDWRVSINYLKNLTGYNFLSELPDSIQQAIGSRDNGLLPNAAPLMADSNSVSSSLPDYIGDDFSIRKTGLRQVTATKTIKINDGIIENTSSKRCFTKDSSTKIGFFKPNIFHSGIGQDSIFEIGSVHNGVSDCSPIQVNSSENGITQINIFDDGITQTSADEFSSTQIDIAKAGIRNISY